LWISCLFLCLFITVVLISMLKKYRKIWRYQCRSTLSWSKMINFLLRLCYLCQDDAHWNKYSYILTNSVRFYIITVFSEIFMNRVKNPDFLFLSWSSKNLLFTAKHLLLFFVPDHCYLVNKSWDNRLKF
jgi:hypothetical protein